MKRSGFKPKFPRREAKQCGYTARPRAAAVAASDGKARMVVPLPKERPVQDERYMAVVRQFPCAFCGICGFTQFCHADEGKGMAIKTDCRLGWPGCGPHGNDPGCHWRIGSSGEFGRDWRRAFEAQAGAETRAKVRDLGLWPKGLPAWPADELDRASGE